MSRWLSAFSAAAVVGLVLGASSTASAQVFAPFYGFAAGTGPYNLYTQQQPPYFSMYPPVYYSYPVARTYGFSPFAYPPGVMTPDPNAMQPPVEVINPHTEKKASAGPPLDRQADSNVQPLMVENPYVVQPAGSRQQLSSRAE